MLAWTDDAPPVEAGMCHRGPGLQPDIAPSRDQARRLASALSASFANGSLRVAHSRQEVDVGPRKRISSSDSDASRATGPRHQRPKIARLVQEGNTTGDPAPKCEVARMWRLGRRMYLLCADPEDPCKGWVQRRLVRGSNDSIPGACVPHTNPGAPQRLIGLFGSLNAGRRQPMENRLV